MKKIKRFAAILLAGIMALALLTACGGSDTGIGTIDKEKQDVMEKQLVSVGIVANDPELYQIALKNLETDMLFSKGKPLFRSSIYQKGIDPREKNVILTVTAKYSDNTDLTYLTAFMATMLKQNYPDANLNVSSGWSKAAVAVKTNTQGSYVALCVQVENPAFQ